MKYYILIKWPKSQEYMDYNWFHEEAILNINSSADYFIPVNRILNLKDLFLTFEELINNSYGEYITLFMEKFKEYNGDGIKLWEEELLGNISKQDYITYMKTDEKFSQKWGNLLTR